MISRPVFRSLCVPRRSRYWTAFMALLILSGLAVDSAQGQLFGRRLLRRRCRSVARTAPAKASQEATWRPLFDGKSMGKWESTKFGGEGKVKVEKGAIRLGFGYSLSGITYQGKIPKVNYEIRLEAMKVDGIDFFCGLTFPIADSHCSFIVGGWAGGIVGISSINGIDASENETTKYMTFDKNRWYKIRVRVTKDNIKTWIDEKNIVDLQIRGRKMSVRPEVDLSKPLGIAAWETKAALRNIQIRELRPSELKGD